MSDHDHDDNLIHLDGLRELALRASVAAGPGEKLAYEQLGVCTPDLLAMAEAYGEEIAVECAKLGMGLNQILSYQYLAGFDIGYQAALERESRVQASSPIDGVEYDGQQPEEA